MCVSRFSPVMTSVAATSSTTPSAVSSTISPFSQRRCERPPVTVRVAPKSWRRFPRVARRAGAEPDQQRTDRGNQRGVGQYDRVDRDIVKTRNIARRQTDEQVERPPCDDDTADGRSDGQSHSLSQQQPNDSRSRGTERYPKCEFRLARDTARRHQVGEVDARDQQHAADCRQQEEQRPLRAADNGVVLQSDQRAAMGMVFGVRLGQSRSQAPELGLNTLQSDPVSHPPDNLDEVGAPLTRHRRVGRRLHTRVFRHRHPQLGGRRRDGEVEAWRGDADNREAPPVHGQRAADRVRHGSQITLPEVFTDHHDIGTGVLFVAREIRDRAMVRHQAWRRDSQRRRRRAHVETARVR